MYADCPECGKTRRATYVGRESNRKGELVALYLLRCCYFEHTVRGEVLVGPLISTMEPRARGRMRVPT